MKKEPPLKVMVSAGELSGDQHAARVISALQKRDIPVEVRGMGGDNLLNAGMTLVVDAKASGSLNGFNIPLILWKSFGAFLKLLLTMLKWKPHVLLVVDYPDFNLRLARFAHLLGIPVVYYIPPKVWAWRSKRISLMKHTIKRIALIFPFEKQFYESRGYRHSIYVGHPFIDTISAELGETTDRSTFLKEHGLNPDHPVVVVLPGSRPSEVTRHLPVMYDGLSRIRTSHPDLQAMVVVAPSLSDEFVAQHIPDDSWVKVSRASSLEAMKHADAGLLKSGTCNLEAAFIGLPFVCFYTAPRITEFIVRKFVRLKEYSLVNIIRSGTVRELIQQQATPEAVKEEIESLLFNQDYRKRQQEALKEIVESLSEYDAHPSFQGTASASDRAAIVLEETGKPRIGAKGVYERLLSYLRPHRSGFIAAMICMILFGASDGAVPFLVKYILDGVFAEKNTGLLTLLPIILFAFAIIRAVVDFGQQFLMAKLGHCIVQDMRNEINRHLLTLSPGFFVHRSSADMLSRFTSDVVLVRTLLTTSFASVIRDTIRIVALLIAAVYLDPLLALLAFIIFPIGLVPVYRFGKRMRKLSKRGQDAIGSLSAIVQEGILGIRVVKIFGREKFEQKRFEKENQNLHNTFIKSEMIRAITGPINEVLATLAIAGVILYGGYSVISGVRSQGDFIAFLLSVFLLYDPFKKLSRLNNQIQQGLSGAERIFELMDTKSEVVDPQEPVPFTPGQVEFDHVGFSYEGTDEYALKDIHLTVPEGRRFALVGFSGAGKSTFVDLIPRFMDVTEGEIRIGGTPIKNVALADLRGHIAMVSQHTFLFNASIYHNIAYGKIETTQAEVEEAARAAFAYDFIMKLPRGFDTIVGESGLTLSGGERQRIAIARAILKDAPLLILDEATASLDNKAEREVQIALERLSKNRTSIVIAHRLSTIQSADCIIVLEDGRVVEAGTHDELLKQGGAFSRLYRLQFESLQPESEKVLN